MRIKKLSQPTDASKFRNNIFADYTSPECLQSIGLLLLEKDKDYSLPDIGRIPHNIVCGTACLNCIVYVWSDTLIIVAL